MAVEADQLWSQFANTTNERLDDLAFRPLPGIGAPSNDPEAFGITLTYQCADETSGEAATGELVPVLFAGLIVGEFELNSPSA